MRSKKKNFPYVPPIARDLSGMGAIGQVQPTGGCVAGPYPYYACVAGPSYYASCTTGNTADTSYCNPGGNHFEPTCYQGASATTQCKSGSHQNF